MIFVKVIDLNFFLIGNEKKKPMCQYVLYSKSMSVRYNSVCVSVLFSCKFVPEQKFKKGILEKRKTLTKKLPTKLQKLIIKPHKKQKIS